jgi:hypothetical protein
VQRWLGELKALGVIEFCANPKNPNQRGMRLCDPHDKNVVPPDSSVMATPDKNVTQNNTRENNTRESRPLTLETFLQNHEAGASTVIVEWSRWACAEFSWSLQRCRTVFDTFRDYWKAQPGSKALKADWEATWRNWCRRETTTFSKPAKLEKGEVRVRESTPAEKLQANGNAKFLQLLKLPENLRKTPDEIAAMVEQNGSAM